MITPIDGVISAVPPLHSGSIAGPGWAASVSFGDMLTTGLSQVEQRLATADAAVQAFALDDSVPLHQVTFALEEARLAMELMLQVRSRLVEGYQELMRMPL